MTTPTPTLTPSEPHSDHADHLPTARDRGATRKALTPRARGRRSRRKGAAWQAELARRWRESGLYGDAHSTQGAQTRSGRCLGTTPPDVDGTPWWVEAKHQRRPRPIAALEQAEAERAAAGDERPAIAVVRPHGCGASAAVVCMRLETFEALVRAVREGREA